MAENFRGARDALSLPPELIEGLAQAFANAIVKAIQRDRLMIPNPGPTDVPVSERAAEEILSTRDAAVYIGYSAAFLQVARRERRGPAFLRVGRSIRYRIQDLDAWLLQLRVSTRECR